jgi:fatty-acyl-CoA synthase
MFGTMQDFPLTVKFLFDHGARIHAQSKVHTFLGDRTRCATFAEVAARAARLAAGLKRLGIQPGDRVGTFSWNNQQNLEAYFAIPSMGAVNHTLNIRLFPDQLAYIVNHAADRVILVDESLLPVFAKVVPDLKTVERYIVIGSDDGTLPGSIGYEELLAAEEPHFDWPEIDERAGAAMCYTSGTTGNPKVVVYTHRSEFIHALAACMTGTLGVCETDRLLLIPPMFHANAWGLPYAGWMAGADMTLPGRFLQAEPLCRLIAQHRITFTSAVPTVLNDILRYADTHEVDFSSLREMMSGGAAVPRSLIDRFQRRFGVKVTQGWGMTETSPLAAIARPPKGSAPEDELNYRVKTGRVVAGIEMRLADGDKILPWDGTSIGEIEVRGPWITGAYFGDDTPEKFHDGWLRTGDVGTIDSMGYVQISDRSKDVIKSGGEWVSSVDLENELMAHPDVLEATVIGVPDERWDERPMACVVLKQGSVVTLEDLRGFLFARVARFWVPERWAFIDEVPKTSVGKFDKKILRARYSAGTLDVKSAIDVLKPAVT